MRKRVIELDAVIEFDRDSVRYFAAGSTTGTTARSIGELDSSVLRGKRIAIVLSRRLTFTRSIPLPDASDKDLSLILRGKLGDIFPIPGHELAFAFSKTESVTMDGRICTVFAVRSEEIRRLFDLSKDHGFTISQIVPVSSIRPEGLSTIGQAILVEPVPTGYGIDVYEDGVLTLSRSIGTGIGVEDEIERLKSNKGAIQVLSTSPDIVGASFTSGPIAALLPAIGSDIDLEPEDIREAKEKKARAYRHRMAYLTFAAGIAITALVVNDFLTRSDEVAKKQRKADVQVASVKKMKALYEDKITKLDPQAKQVKLAFAPAQRISDIAFIVSGLVPKGAWLTGLTIERGKTITIRGTAKDADQIASFVKSLGEQNRFRDVKLIQVSSGTIESAPVFQFTVNAFPVGNLPIMDQGKLR